MKKRIAYILSAAVVISALAGCNSKPAVTEAQPQDTSAPTSETTQSAAPATLATSVTAREIADSLFPGDASDYTAWKDIDRSEIIAYLDTDEYGDWFDITFGEFFNEYMYYLVSYNIADDMSEENKDKCMNYRDNIITYLTFEKMYLYEADHKYGISESTLTEDQIKEIKENADQVKNDWASNFYDTVSEKLGTSVSIDTINATCREVLNIILGKCGLDENIFYRWELNKYIQDLVIKELTKNISIEDSQVEDLYSTFLDEAKDKAENNVEEYESSAVYMMVYIPEGTRSAKHILLSFDDDSLSAIAEAANKGDTAEVSRLTEAAYTDKLKTKVNEIKEKLAAGEDFTELQEKYGSVGGDEYVVLKNSPSFFDEYKNALYALGNKGDVSEPVLCQNGIYFIQYSDDAKVSEDSIKQIKDNMREYLVQLEQNVRQNEAYTEWSGKYNYIIDKELLKIEESDESIDDTETFPDDEIIAD